MQKQQEKIGAIEKQADELKKQLAAARREQKEELQQQKREIAGIANVQEGVKQELGKLKEAGDNHFAAIAKMLESMAHKAGETRRCKKEEQQDDDDMDSSGVEEVIASPMPKRPRGRKLAAPV